MGALGGVSGCLGVEGVASFTEEKAVKRVGETEASVSIVENVLRVVFNKINLI